MDFEHSNFGFISLKLVPFGTINHDALSFLIFVPKKYGIRLTIGWIYATNKIMENTSFHTLHFKYNALPEKLKSEVLDFVDFLLVKERRIKGDKKQKMPKFGSCKGMFEMSPDFDEPLEDFKDYMY